MGRNKERLFKGGIDPLWLPRSVPAIKLAPFIIDAMAGYALN